MIQLKGSAKRNLLAPGYHIKPKYDLPELRKRVKGGKREHHVVELPLTPMIDMFSLLIIFLLMNFSSTGETFFINRNVILPKAEHGRPLESFPLVSITDKEVVFEAEKVGSNPLILKRSDNEFPRLQAMLKKIKDLDQKTHPEKPFKGAVNIQADQGLAVAYIKRVMNVLISEGWTEIHFAVRNKKE